MKDSYNEAAEIGKRIKKARLEANLTQKQLHELTDISITQISAYENGSKNIGIQSLNKIAKATNKTMDEIYNCNIIAKSLNEASTAQELIVLCIDILVQLKVITCINSEKRIYKGGLIGDKYDIRFTQNYPYVEALVIRLIDFYCNKENYSDPNNFKKQLIEACIKHIDDKSIE